MKINSGKKQFTIRAYKETLKVNNFTAFALHQGAFYTLVIFFTLRKNKVFQTVSNRFCNKSLSGGTVGNRIEIAGEIKNTEQDMEF